VIRLDAAARRVVVGPHEALGCGRVALREVNWIGAERPANGAPVTVRLRSTHPGAPATVVAGDGDAAEVILDTPEHGVAPGQACVVYRGERVLGGGFIARAEPARAAA
jgi:tRNA-specific 2-thiouridylase